MDPVSTVYSHIHQTQIISVLVFVTHFLFFCQAQITMKVIQGLYSGVTTVELDTLAAETAATLTTKYPDYAILAARIAVSNLHKETKKVFSGETGTCVKMSASVCHSLISNNVFFCNRCDGRPLQLCEPIE